MKKYLMKIAALLIAVTFVSVPTLAVEEPTSLTLDWYGDYTNMELVINVYSPADYNQQITAVLYDAAVTDPTFADYCRTTEVTAVGGRDTQIRFKITDSLNASGGAYKLWVQGSGSLATNSKKVENVWILNPSNVNPNIQTSLLYQINTATKDTVLPYIKKMAKALKINVNETESDNRLAAFINVRTKDYTGGKFPTIDNAADAFKISGVIEYLQSASPTDSLLKTKFVEVKDILGIDTADTDYIAHETDIYKNIIILKQGGTATSTISDIKMMFNQAKALAVINKSTSDTIAQNFVKYYSAIGITDTEYTAFTALEDDDEATVLRQLLNKNFTTVASAKTAVTAAVGTLSGTTPPADGDNGKDEGAGSGLGGGGGGASFGGGSRNSNKDNANNQDSQTTTSNGFSDLESDHWAYIAVQNLKENAIINGYPDGNFYPSRSVNREEFVKMIIAAAGLFVKDANCDFNDVQKDTWFYSYVASAVSQGIINGVSETSFGSGQSIKREDVALIIYRILFNMSLTKESGDSLDTFTDASLVSEYAKEAVATLTSMGILSGFDDGSFRPQAPITRAEAAKVLYGFREYVRQNSGEGEIK